ncbi:hypothetical protein H2198_003863 [Neophaeococcomyces mojaviensis]|uniref:Uncharacterized protein n=1 Tax=Neophaeococcomyces mojaviensis TaxID=3383035 RepID=A0ACC3AAH1_9EURO|nr:hypothetical protein H2198_003863 [Knufia sp. JES_112]
MAILSNFEITILTLRTVTSTHTGLPEQQWHPLAEHYPPKFDATRTDFCEKYIGVPSLATLSVEPGQGLSRSRRTSQFAHHASPVDIDDLEWPESAVESETERAVEFAIDYKVHCGFTFNDSDEADLIVFRTYLDGERIGSGFVKRDRWERRGTYRVRKKGKRVWIDDPFAAVGEWVQQKWTFAPGHHGTLKIEAWRETHRAQHVRQGMFQTPSNTGWMPLAAQYPDTGVIDLTGMSDDLSAIESVTVSPRVKKTRKIDLWPMATFVFEYRSEETLKTLGMIREPDMVMDDDDETEAGPMPKRAKSPQPLQPRQYCYDTSQFWSSPSNPAPAAAFSSICPATAMSDAEFDALLNQTQADCQEVNTVDLTTDTTLRSYSSMTTNSTSYTTYSSTATTNYELYSDNKEFVSQTSSKGNDPPQNCGTEVVDLTMLD